jgi:hypothetical protein
LGRMLFTWFNPGSATGYVFAVLNLTAVVLIGYLAPAMSGLPATPVARGMFRPLPQLGDYVCVSGLVLGYVAGYLGVTRLLVIAARRFTPVAMPATFLCHILALTFGVLIPLFVQGAIAGWNYSDFDYTPLQLPNWVWTMGEALERGAGTTALFAATIVVPVGMVIFFVNFALAAREIQHVRQAAPVRVIEDEAALHPTQPKKRNPWDEAT